MRDTPAIPDYRSFKRLIVGAVIALILLITGFSVWKATAEYRLTIRAAEHLSRGYTRALKEHAERAFSEADNVLLDTLDHIQSRGGIDRETSLHLQDLLRRHPRNIPQIGSIILVNRDGLLFAHSLDTPVSQANVADREYFIHHRDNPTDDYPFLSRPVQSRINGKWRFTLSRPVRSPNGSFEGLVAVAFEMEYFQNFYSSLDIGKKGRIVIVRKDGAVLMTQPFKDTDFSTDFSKSFMFRTYLPKSPKGTFHIKGGKALLEKTPRIISYESLESFPVVANANMGTDEVTATWRSTTYKQAVVTASVCLALILLTISLLRQIRRIEQAAVLQGEQQAELVSAEERYRALVENLPVVTWQSDVQGRTRFISSNVEKIYGYTPDEIYSGGEGLWLGRIHPDEVEKVAGAYRSLFDGTGIYDVEYRIRHKDGHWIWLSDFAYTTTLQKGVRVAHGIFGDVTARKLAEESRDLLEMQLHRAQKMEAIGHLAGGIAHDFNNLLTPIMGYAEMVAAKMAPDDPSKSKMSGILAAASKAKGLTGQLLNFGRRQAIVSTVVDLNEIIRSFHTILVRTIRENISIELKLAPEGSCIKADRSQMEQVILNLTVNAQDAINDKGRIFIETRTILMSAEDVSFYPGMPAGEYVLLRFQDNGCGMNEDVISHIFEPFFTTKGVGHGTGLGLATVYGIVKQHDAQISVSSRAGIGTTFSIFFPRSGPAIQPERPVHMAVSENLCSGGADKIILLVEDDSMVRTMVTEMLESNGFKVLAASGPLKAFEVLAEGSSQIDLLVSDVVMPDMNGPELYERLVESYPDLKAVYMSGYPVNPGSKRKDSDDEFQYLQKPFTGEELLQRIRQVL